MGLQEFRHRGAPGGDTGRGTGHRGTQGFTGQLLRDNTPQPLGAKAEDPPEGNFVPESGAKLTHYQLGAGFTF